MTTRILQRLLTRLVAGAVLCPGITLAEEPSPPEAGTPEIVAGAGEPLESIHLRQDTLLRGSVAAGAAGPLFVSADRLESDGASAVIAEGRVEARQAGRNFFADWLRYDTALDEVRARGGVRFEQQHSVLTGETLDLRLDTLTGRLTPANFFLLARQARGTASEALFAGSDHLSLADASYTTCPVGNDDWYLRVGKLDIDHGRSVGSARNARLEFLGVPILYAPWFDFPLDNQRKSGFLAPTFGTTQRSGADLLIPYYLNLAPNYDATLAPRILTKRGLQLGGEFRHLLDHAGGEARLEFLPGDKVTGENRWSALLSERARLGPRIDLAAHFEAVSDSDYFRDLSNLVNLTSLTHLRRELKASYQGDWWQASLLAQGYQTLDDPAVVTVKPYSRLPSLGLTAARDLPGGFEFEFSGEATRFDHASEISGNRVWGYPSVKLPLEVSWGFFTPKVGLHSTRYRLDDAAPRRAISRDIPILSLDTGAYLDRSVTLFGQEFLQSLEPRAYYVFAPARDQSDIPVFDTGLLDFSYSQIFTENQFVGADRINDANQLTLAATSRFIEAGSAFERLRLTLGQRYYFSSQTVTLPGMPPRASNATDLLLAASGQLTRAWRFDSLFQLDTQEGRAVRRNLSASYRPAPGHTLNFGYRHIDQSTEQLDLSTQWPLGDRWYGMFRTNYSLRDNQLVEGVAGLEYNAGCWTARGAVQRIATRENQSTDAFFIQLELNGMGRLGSNPLDVLKYSIPGFQTRNELSPP